MTFLVKYIFIGLVLIILGVFIFIGYIYYDSTKSLKEVVSLPNQNSDSPVTKTQESPFHSDVVTPQPLTRTTVTKRDYQPGETERLFYRAVIESFKPKPFQIPKQIPEQLERMISEGVIRWNEIYKTFPPRASYPAQTMEILQFITKRYTEPLSNDLLESKKELQELIDLYNKAVSDSRQYYQDIIINLQELTKQCPDSPYYPHYQETLNLIIQMQKEDEEFYDKYTINARDVVTGMSVPDVYYRDFYPVNRRLLPLDERINAYIYCFRYSYFNKSNGRYAIG